MERLLYPALGLLLLTGFYPLWRAWRASRRTTLRHAIAWTAAAWAAWVAAAGFGPDAGLARYVALALTGCAAVAVLGARRPIVAAWNFVVGSLLVVLLWPVVERMGDLRPGGLLTVAAVLLSAAILVGMVNYLPTRIAAAVLPAGAACAAQVCVVVEVMERKWGLYALALLAVAPWLGMAARRRTPPADAIDREWLDFRDRFGAVWRCRPASSSTGRRPTPAGMSSSPGRARTASGDVPRRAEALTGLRALLKRFRTDGEVPAGQ